MHTLPATDHEPAAWLPLSMAPGLRPGALRAMMDASSLPDAIPGQPFALLAAVTDEVSARCASAARRRVRALSGRGAGVARTGRQRKS
jgi:DNA processing protein